MLIGHVTANVNQIASIITADGGVRQKLSEVRLLGLARKRTATFDFADGDLIILIDVHYIDLAAHLRIHRRQVQIVEQKAPFTGEAVADRILDAVPNRHVKV